jgi:hypothetical protein
MIKQESKVQWSATMDADKWMIIMSVLQYSHPKIVSDISKALKVGA